MTEYADIDDEGLLRASIHGLTDAQLDTPYRERMAGPSDRANRDCMAK